MAEGSTDQSPRPTRFKKAVRAGALATGLTTFAILGNNIIKGNESGQSNTPEYRTYGLHDSAIVKNWDERLHGALQTGAEVRMADLTIEIPANQTLNARYSPSVIHAQDGTTGNLAVEFNAGTEFTIENALLVDGDYSDVNDRTSNKWAWIDGESVGLKHDIFINLGEANRELVTEENTERGVIQATNPKGDIFVENGGETNLAPGTIIFNTSAKAIEPKK